MHNEVFYYHSIPNNNSTPPTFILCNISLTFASHMFLTTRLMVSATHGGQKMCGYWASTSISTAQQTGESCLLSLEQHYLSNCLSNQNGKKILIFIFTLTFNEFQKYWPIFSHSHEMHRQLILFINSSSNYNTDFLLHPCAFNAFNNL